jgi:signal peptidase I
MTDRMPRPRLRRPGLLQELIGTLIFILSVYALAEMAIPRSNIDGPSMQPNLHAGQYLIISRLDYLFGEPQRGDVAVFQAPGSDDDEPRLIKRVIGLPGDTVEIRDTEVYVNGEKLDEPYFINRPCNPSKCPNETWTLGPSQYFMMGDNRNNSRDSRAFGPIQRSAIVGRAVFRYLPLSEFGAISTFR